MQNPKIKLISDSTCDLSKNLVKEHDIDIVPLYVNFDEESYRDGIDLTTEKMYDMVKKKNKLPKTAAASPGDFVEVFDRYLKQGHEIIYLGIGAHFSATYASATHAKNILDTEKIHLIDSQNLSSGSGLLLLKAAKFRAQGDDVLTIVEKVQALVPKVRSQFVIDTLEYLHRGGRITGLSHLMGSMLRIKPIIKVIDGKMAVGKKARGNVKAGLKLLIKDLQNIKNQLDQDYLMITHSLAAESYRYVKEEITGKLPINNIYETQAGCVISSHCGKGTIGILYITNSD